MELKISDWDCYSGEIPADLDVFVIDTMNLDGYSGDLLELSEKDIKDYDDLIPAYVEGCRIDGRLYVVPQMLCTDLLYTRKSDTEMKNVQSIPELHAILKGRGLLADKSSNGSKVFLYLQALIDEKQRFIAYFPMIGEEELSTGAYASLTEIRDMRQKDANERTKDSTWYYLLRPTIRSGGRESIYWLFGGNGGHERRGTGYGHQAVFHDG